MKKVRIAISGLFVFLVLITSSLCAQNDNLLNYVNRQSISLSNDQQSLLDRISSKKKTETVHLIQIKDPKGKLDQDFVILNLPSHEIKVQRQINNHSDLNRPYWYGKIVNRPLSTVSFSVTGTEVFGHINTGEKIYAIRPLKEDYHCLIEINQKEFLPQSPIPSWSGYSDSTKLKSSLLKSSQMSTDPVIQVLVAYTPQAKAASADIRALINEAANLANISYDNSDASLSIHIVGMVEVDYTETGSLSADLRRLTASSSYNPFGSTWTDTEPDPDITYDIPGYMEEVHTLRDDLKADIVALIVEHGNYAGVAWPFESSNFAFSVTVYDQIDGYTFSHEIGHNLQAYHDRDNADNPYYSYGHGYRFSSQPQKRTIMAYYPGKIVNYWSNPNITINGVAIGTASYEDNARVLDESSPAVEAYKSSTTPGKLVFNNGYTVDVDEPLTIASGTTVELGDDLVINSGSELTIQSGVTLNFDPGAEFVINGTLIFGPDATLSGENIEVNSGGELVIKDGATLSFGSGQGITSYGKVLISSGGTPITLEPTGSSWDGVHLYGAGADDSFIYNVTIEDASTGIGVYNTQDVAISITSITGSQNNGVQLSSSDNVIFTEVDIEQSDDAGILVDGGDASIAGGSINLNDMEGVFADGGAYVDGPNSTLLDGNVSATFRLGGSSYMNPHNSSSVNVSSGSYHGLALSTSELDAEDNWWDGSPPDAGKFGAFSGSTIDYNPWLFFPPIYPMIAPEHPEQRTKTNPGNDFENPGPDFDEPLFTSAGKLRAYLKQYPPQERMQVMETARNRLPQSQQPWLDILEIEGFQKSGDYKTAEAAAQGLINNQTLPASLRATAGRRLFIQQLMGEHRYAQARKTLNWITRLTPEEDREHLDWMYGLMNTFGREETAPPVACEHCSPSEELSATPLEISNHPNPFNPLTHISYHLPVKTEVSLIVYDVMGREIATLVNETKPAGSHTIPFDASRLSSGIYLYRLVAGNEVTTGRMTLIK